MQLVSDLVNSELNPNLNAYRGFTPAQNFKAQGLFSPHWGNTFKFPQPHDPEHPRNPKNFQGIYLGAGPYFSLGTDVVIDPLLIDIFSSPTPVFFPNTTLTTHSTTELQTAAALTGGYRARFSAPEFLRNSFMKDKQPCDGNGVYITANLNYLQGLHYENIDSNVDLNTNALGLVELIPSTTPVVVNRLFGNGGHGFSVDFAGAVVVDRFSVSVAIRGIGNYIDWRDLEVEKWELNSVFTGASFVHSEPVHVGGKTRVKLPTRYSVLAGYHAPRWSTDVDVFYGLNKFEFYGGAEYRWHMLDFRAGARRSLGLWNPAAGVGINFTRKVGLDIAGFGTTTDLELQRKAGIAASLRIERKK
jgi:hypothetical protein